MSTLEGLTDQLHAKNLPPGWRWSKLADLLVCMESGSRPKGGAVGVTSGVPSISAEHMTPQGPFDFSVMRYVPREYYENMPRGHIRRGDILIVKDGATTGKTCFVDKSFPFREAVVNEHVFICRADDQKILPRLLFYWLWGGTGQNAIRTRFQGAAIGGINQGFAVSVTVPVPPIEEQSRILTRLLTSMRYIAGAHAASEARIADVAALKSAILRSTFAPEKMRHWNLRTIKEISHLVTDGPHVTPTYVPRGVPFVTVTNIQSGCLNFENVSYVTEDDHKHFSARAKAERGDILYSKDGTLGIPCVVDTDREFSFFVSVAIIKLKRDLVDPHFVAHAMTSPFVMHQVERLGAGAGLKHMVLKSIRALEIPCPPLQEQRQIADSLTSQLGIVAQAERACSEELNTILALPGAVIRHAFQEGV